MENVKEAPLCRGDQIFMVLLTFFCVNLVITNLLASKIFSVPFLPSVALSVADLNYPITFLITDIIAEVWGKRRATLVVYAGFAMNVFMLLMVQLALNLPPHGHWVSPENPFGYQDVLAYQNAYSSVFGVSGHLVLGSMLAFITSQLADIQIFHFLKNLTQGRFLWLRNNVSTMTSQLIDTSIFATVFFHFGLGLSAVTTMELAAYMYACKFVLALLDTPFCYLGVRLLRLSGAAR